MNLRVIFTKVIYMKPTYKKKVEKLFQVFIAVFLTHLPCSPWGTFCVRNGTRRVRQCSVVCKHEVYTDRSHSQQEIPQWVSATQEVPQPTYSE